MNKIFSFILLIFLVIPSEVNSQCETVSDFVKNETRLNHFSNNGMISNLGNTLSSAYFDRAGQEVFSLGYAKSLWVGGLDPVGNLKLAGNTYPSGAEDDFIPGPLDRQTGQPLDSECTFFNRIWKVNAFQVFILQSQWDNNSLTLESVPADVLEWPAIGNPHIDFDIQNPLAPFFDRNDDGRYDPLEGDYPLAIEENTDFIPFEFTFCVYNDVTEHTSTQGAPLQMEFHQTNYVISNPDRAIGQTVFTRLKYIYLGGEDLFDFRASIFEDNDLGCFNNDYQGCNTDLNCVYYYNRNGETSLEDQCFGLTPVPDDNGAIRTTVFLNKPLISHGYFTNGIIGEAPPVLAGPTTSFQYYQIMGGHWVDGTPMTIGGDGFDPASTDETLFAFPDLPTDENGWSMQTSDLIDGFDYRAVTTFQSGNLAPGSINIIDLADYVLYDPSVKKLEIFDQWPEKVGDIQSDYDKIIDGTYDGGVTITPCEADCVWPGDANNDGIVTGEDAVIVGVLSSVEDLTGNARPLVSSEWFPFSGEDWGQNILSNDYKFADVDGSGFINQADLVALENNFNRNYDGAELKLIEPSSPDPLGLSVTYNKSEISASGSVADRNFKVEVQLGNDVGEIGAPIHGLSYMMRFDTNLVRPFFEVEDPPLQDFLYRYTFMKDAERNELVEVEGDNNIQYAFSRIQLGNRESGGRTSDQLMIVREGAKTPNPDGRDTVIVRLYNVFGMNQEQEVLDIGVIYDTLIITDLIVDPDVISSNDQQFWKSAFQFFPNPVENNLHINFNFTKTGRIDLLDANGRLIQGTKVSGLDQIALNTEGLITGVYFIRFKEQEGQITTKRFIKI